MLIFYYLWGNFLNNFEFSMCLNMVIYFDLKNIFRKLLTVEMVKRDFQFFGIGSLN